MNDSELDESNRFHQKDSGGGSVPVPDPTVLTTQQLQREIATSREVVEVQIEGIKRVFETRFDAMDRAVDLRHRATDIGLENALKSILQLQYLHDEKLKVFEEKFRSIATQFLERDTRTEQTSRDSKVAVDAALQAAKEAVGEQNKSNSLAIAKSETTFTKQIDQIIILIQSLQNNLNDKIDDLKSRLQSVEGQKKGSVETYSFVVGVVATVIAIITVVVTVMRNK